MRASGKNRWAAVAVAAVTVWQINSAEAETATISQAQLLAKPDGTAAHPFPDASQCSADSDLVFWPSGGPAPSFPTSISVCFVESRNSGPGSRRGAWSLVAPILLGPRASPAPAH
jgi:hypothetical protein